MAKSFSVAALTISSLLLGGCASMNVGSGGLGESLSGLKHSLSTAKEGAGYEDRFSLGLYAVAGIGPSRLEPDTSELDGWDSNDRVEPAGQITVGADLTKYLSVEAHSADLGSAGLSPVGRINYHIDGISALVYAGGNRHRYRRQGLKAFGRVGVGSLDNTTVGPVPFIKDNAVHLLVGAGLEYMTPIGVGLRAEGVSFDKDVQYAQVGLMYRTGANQKTRRPKLAAATLPIETAPVETATFYPAPPPPPSYAAALPVIDQCEGLEGVLNGVNFSNDSAVLNYESQLILDDVMYTVSNCNSVILEISAHTSSVGSVSYNYDLSVRRAQSVVEYLGNQGLNRDRMNALSFGESSPLDVNNTAEGQARNRRVEIYAR